MAGLVVNLGLAVRRNRRWLLGFSIPLFLLYAALSAHTPGEPRTPKDFLFIVGVFAVPFALLVYPISLLLSCSHSNSDGRKPRARIALLGSVFASVSAFLLLLLSPCWSIVVGHELLGECWVAVGSLMAAAATICGIVGESPLRRPAVLSSLLLPFWYFLATLLLKVAMD
jgi:hypothetical protein